MAYDPFARGPHAFDVTTDEVTDASRDRRLPLVVWRPRRVDRAPLVVFSHSSYGDPRGSSFLMEHLASHGYVVAAPEHTGNTRRDLRPAGAPPLTPPEREAFIARMIRARVPDMIVTLDRMIADRGVDAARIAVAGWSFGGWAALATIETDARPAAVVALAASGGEDPLPGIIPARLTYARRRVVPALFLAADRDQFIPASAVAETFRRSPPPKRMFTLRDADHGHFADEVPAGMCPPHEAHLFTCALALAHLDDAIRDDPGARAWLGDDPLASLRSRGVDAY